MIRRNIHMVKTSGKGNNASSSNLKNELIRVVLAYTVHSGMFRPLRSSLDILVTGRENKLFQSRNEQE